MVGVNLYLKGENMTNGLDLGIEVADKLIQHSKGIFSYLRLPRTNAENLLTTALRENGTIQSSDLEAAATQFLIRKFVKRLKNYDEIIDKAERNFEELLKEAAATDDPLPKCKKVNEDWLEYFYDMSSRVSDDIVQEIWARLLVKEHIQPGCVQKVLLNTLAMMDNETASSFSTLCRLTYELTIDKETRLIPLVLYDTEIKELTEDSKVGIDAFTSYAQICPSDDQLEMLNEIGLITLDFMRREHLIYFSEQSTAKYEYLDFEMEIKGQYDDSDKVYFVETGLVFFTQIGLSLYKSINIEPFDQLSQILKRFVEHQGGN